MIAKMIGAFCIFGASACIGFGKALELSRRTRYLQNLKTAFSILESEISFSANSMQRAFSNISRAVDTKGFLESVAQRTEEYGAREAWRMGVEENQMRLTPDDQEVLYAFGSELGMTDRENQVKNIRYITSLVEGQYERAEAERQKSARLYQSFGVLGGIFLVILFL
jgi:stage III sporulation protein AB